MSLFQQSSLTFAQAKTKVARAASAEADSDMLTKTGDALEAAVQTWNNRRHWNFLRATHTFALMAPFTVASCTTVSENTSVSAPSLSDVVAGDVVSGTGIRSETYVQSVDTSGSPDTMVLSQPASAAGTVTLSFARRDYAAPTNYKYIYNMRNVTTGRKLQHVDSRLYDNVMPEQSMQDEPFFYDQHPMGADGKFRFLPTPSARHMVEAKYYRRMTVPSVDGTALDIPIDFEWGILSEAKAIFLAEKGGYDALAAFWAAKAKEALALAVQADGKQPDEMAGFLPGSMAGGSGSNSFGVMPGTDGGGGWGENWGEDWGGD